MSNIRKHSGASEFSITVSCDYDDVITVAVADNGKEFPPLPKQTEDLANEGKLGLLGMQERARLISGILEIQSELGSGTTVILKAPAEKSHEALNS